MKRAIKFVLTIIALLSFAACTNTTPQILDGDGMVYNDAEFRTEYANALDFDNVEGAPYWAVAFLGYGDVGRDMRDIYVLNAFDSLSEESVNKVEHFNFEGDEWYLVIPRYKGENKIKNLSTNEEIIVYEGAAFSIKCNLSDIHPNVEISIDTHGGKKFSPQVSGAGELVTSDDIWDITESVLPKFE